MIQNNQPAVSQKSSCGTVAINDRDLHIGSWKATAKQKGCLALYQTSVRSNAWYQVVKVSASVKQVFEHGYQQASRALSRCFKQAGLSLSRRRREHMRQRPYL